MPRRIDGMRIGMGRVLHFDQRCLGCSARDAPGMIERRDAIVDAVNNQQRDVQPLHGARGDTRRPDTA